MSRFLVEIGKMTEKKIAKGCTVCVRSGADIWRNRTEEDHREWLESEDSGGIDCAGESKLDSPSRYRVNDGSTFQVVRARASVRQGWHTTPKCSVVTDSSGIEWFVRRRDLAVL